MATNLYKKYTESKTREWEVPSGTQSGQIVFHPVSGQVGVTLTARGDSTASVTAPNGWDITYPNGGVGNKPDCATVAVDGSWLFAVAGSANGETNGAGQTGTPAGTAVYATAARSLTLTEGTNTLVGVIDDGNIVGGVAPVLIGAVL